MYKIPPPPPITKRPKLTADNVVDYIDWIMLNGDTLRPEQIDRHLRAAELVIRTRANEAQGKATQHTLVEDGVIAPPPLAAAAGEITPPRPGGGLSPTLETHSWE